MGLAMPMAMGTGAAIGAGEGRAYGGQRREAPCPRFSRSVVRVGFAEPVIGPATSGRTRWLSPPYKKFEACSQLRLRLRIFAVVSSIFGRLEGTPAAFYVKCFTTKGLEFRGLESCTITLVDCS